ncbi:ABC transporter ATP-binding protein [bacterium]|nr:ABC transporter ATP-binding protein [bacterium]
MRKVVARANNLVKLYPVPRRYSEMILHPFSFKKVLAVDGISIDIEQNEIFGLLGPNGAGKTTLIKMLVGLVFPTSGFAEICGIDIVKNLDQAKLKVGCVLSEERSFFWRLTGRQNLEFFATLYNLNKNVAKARIDYLFELVDLRNKENEQFMSYSTGMKQKMAIARGLLINPEILFMDEPTKSLDPYMASKLRNFVKDEIVVKLGKTVFLATHNLQDVEDMCTKIAIISKGKIKAVGTINEISKVIDSQKKFQIITLNFKDEVKNYLDRIKDIQMDSVTKCEGSHYEITFRTDKENEVVPHITKMLVDNGLMIMTIKEVERSLTEVFSRIVEDKKIE